MALRALDSLPPCIRRSVSLIAMAALFVAPVALYAQQAEPSTAGRPQPAENASQESDPAAHGQLMLVLPFTDKSDSPATNWIGAAFPEILNQRFISAGLLPISREDREYALQHLGLPPDFHPTRASTLRLAQTLDADYVIFGTYSVTNGKLTAEARVLDITGLRESAGVTETADLTRLPDVINALAWRVVRQLQPNYPVAEQTFVGANANMKLDAFENYVRGILAPGSPEGLQHLREAVRLDPNYGPAWFALGQANFDAQNWDEAATSFGHLTRNDPRALQADFLRGLAFLYAGKYLQAEDAFAFVTTRLPLPEVVNNQGVAAERRGKDGTPLFQQASNADPKEPDYHFNLSIAYAKRGDGANAQKEIAEALKLRPNDGDALNFAANLRNPSYLQATLHPPQPVQSPALGGATPAPAPQQGANTSLPLERIRRNFNEAGFRQAAFEMEQMESLRAASEPASKREADLLRDATQYLNNGLLVESEREYREVLGLNPNSADAYAGLARIRERTNDRDAARDAAQKSIQLHDNPGAHVVLARIDLQTNQLPAAASEVSAALRLNANDPEAKGLKLAVVARGQQVP